MFNLFYPHSSSKHHFSPGFLQYSPTWPLTSSMASLVSPHKVAKMIMFKHKSTENLSMTSHFRGKFNII